MDGTLRNDTTDERARSGDRPPAETAGEPLSALFARELRPVLKDLERVRVRNLRLAAAAVLAGVGAGAYLPPAYVQPFGFLFCAVAGAAVASNRYGALRRRFRERVGPALFGALDRSVRYVPGAGLGRDEFDASGLVQGRIDRFSSDDLLVGTRNGVPFRASSVQAERRVQSGPNRAASHRTVFRGIVVIARLPRPTGTRIEVLPNRTPEFLTGVHAWTGVLSGRGEHVRLEDPEFARRFVVYSRDQIAARVVLTPAFMERLTAFARSRPRGVMLAFDGPLLHLVIPTERPPFRVPFLRSLVDYRLVRDALEDARAFLEILDDLELGAAATAGGASPLPTEPLVP